MCCGRTSSNVNRKSRRVSGFKSENDWGNILAFPNNRLQLGRKWEPLMYSLISSFPQLLLEESGLGALPGGGEWSDAWLVRELLYDGPSSSYPMLGSSSFRRPKPLGASPQCSQSPGYGALRHRRCAPIRGTNASWSRLGVLECWGHAAQNHEANKNSSLLRRTLLLLALSMVPLQKRRTHNLRLPILVPRLHIQMGAPMLTYASQTQFKLDLNRGNKALLENVTVPRKQLSRVRLARTLGCISFRRFLGRYAQPTIRYADCARNLLRSVLYFSQLLKANKSNSSSARRFT